MTFRPQNETERIAYELASTLDDMGNIAFYISCANRYPVPILKKALTEVLGVPPEKIKKSRGALFNHVVKRHAEQNNPSH